MTHLTLIYRSTSWVDTVAWRARFATRMARLRTAPAGVATIADALTSRWVSHQEPAAFRRNLRLVNDEINAIPATRATRTRAALAAHNNEG